MGGSEDVAHGFCRNCWECGSLLIMLLWHWNTRCEHMLFADNGNNCLGAWRIRLQSILYESCASRKCAGIVVRARCWRFGLVFDHVVVALGIVVC